jgi:outer membrane protein TolC
MLTIVVLALSAAAAPNGPPLTAAEAVRLAAGDAPAVVRARADSDAALARGRTARSRLGPTLFVDAGFLTTNDPVGVFSLALKQERFSLAEFAASDPNNPPFTQDWSASVAAAWAVDVFGAARGEARAAKSTAEASAKAAGRARDGVAFRALSAFVAARRAEEAIALLEARSSEAEQDVSLARALNEQGLTTEADPARAEAALADLRAQRAAEEFARASARAALAALIGASAASRPLGELPHPQPVPAAAAAPRDDIAAADLAAQAARESAKAASASRFPALVVSGRYDLNAPRPGGRWGDSATVFGGIRIPVFASGAIDARIAEAQASARGAEAAARETRQEAERESATARAALVAAAARLTAFTEAERAAVRAREIQQARYEEGIARLSDLLESRGAELSARLGVAAARSELAVAEARLRLALGLPPEGEENR